MVKGMKTYGFSHSRLLTSFAIIFQIGLIGAVDYQTSIELGFFVFYYIPISYATWQAGRTAGVITSFACASLWMVLEAIGDASIGLHRYPSELYFFWNGIVRLASFLIICFVLAGLFDVLKRERELSKSLQDSLEEVTRLRGLLPICASCKSIRDDKGLWQQIEQYISSHSEAEFTHGICPECARKLYPEYYGKKKEEEK